jgi:hypothetical protein
MMVGTFSRRRLIVGLLVVAALAVSSPSLWANNTWGCYHWARSSNPVQLNIGDNVNSTWDGHLDVAIADWNSSAVLALTEVAGGTRPKNCRPTSGRIEVCNARYGNSGWLGIAQIWVNGCHITQATTKVNDYYFDQPQYNSPAWRQFVMCQEVGHDFGLDHQDETFDNPNLGSCMDYTNDPDGGPGGASNNDPSNEHPDSHDYQTLSSIYSHTDSAATASPSPANSDHNVPAEWGALVRTLAGGRVQVFERDLGNGHKMITRVIWADPEQQ